MQVRGNKPGKVYTILFSEHFIVGFCVVGPFFLLSMSQLEDDAGGGINSGWGKGWGRGMSQKQQRTCSWLIIQCCKSYFGSHGCEQAACVGTGGGDELAVCNDFFESDA